MMALGREQLCADPATRDPRFRWAEEDAALEAEGEDDIPCRGKSASPPAMPQGKTVFAFGTTPLDAFSNRPTLSPKQLNCTLGPMLQ